MSKQKVGLLFLMTGCFAFIKTKIITAAVNAINAMSTANPTAASALLPIAGLSATISVQKDDKKTDQFFVLYT